MIIRVYTGFGSSDAGGRVLIKELREIQSADVLPINDREMREERGWIDKTSLIIFAGKSVGKFKSAIGKDSLSDLKNAIYNGRINYMGICAGAAFAMSEIYYHVDDDRGKRWISNDGLGLFNGMAKGPHPLILRQAFTGSAQDLRRINVYCHQTGLVVPAIYWGGPALIPYERKKDVEVISSLLGSGAPLTLKAKFGMGTVMISSYHPDITSENIKVWVDIGYTEPSDVKNIYTLCQNIGRDNLKAMWQAYLR